MKEYKWDIRILNQMREYLLYYEQISEEKRMEALELLTEMYLLDNEESIREKYCLKDRATMMLANYIYLSKSMSQKQRENLKKLESHIEGKKLEKVEISRFDFEIENVIELLGQFINWLPSKEIGEVLRTYYHEMFSTHFYCCEKNEILSSKGITYKIHSYYPFIVIGKWSFIETFMTLVHEMGHVLFLLLGLDVGRNKNGEYFTEVEGRYFELLALQFLLERKMYVKDGITCATRDYYDLEYYVKRTGLLGNLQSIFSIESIEETLKEIYSYLGSLELFYRYNGDYEKQLYDLISLPNINSKSLDQYLTRAKFSWRENDFFNLEKHKQKLKL